MERPELSVIIPTYNRADMLMTMVESILAQERIALEILVVDDGSTDDTRRRVEALGDSRVRYFRNEKNSGPGYSRRFGLHTAAGDYVVFADDDDWYTSRDFFARAVGILREDRKERFVAVIANALIRYAETGEEREAPLGFRDAISGTEYLRYLGDKYPKPLSTFPAVFRRGALLDAGMLDCAQADDRVIYLRALTQGDVFALEDCIGVYLVHGGNISRRVDRRFVRSLMEENSAVLCMIREKDLFDDALGWWYSQCRHVLRYFILNSRVELWDLLWIYLWVLGRHNPLKQDLAFFRYGLQRWRAKKAGNRGQP